MARLAQQAVGRSELDDPPGVHRGDAVGHAPQEPQVVADDEERGVQVADEGQEQIDDLALHDGVERVWARPR